jgi:hypothetical protein
MSNNRGHLMRTSSLERALFSETESAHTNKDMEQIKMLEAELMGSQSQSIGNTQTPRVPLTRAAAANQNRIQNNQKMVDQSKLNIPSKQTFAVPLQNPIQKNAQVPLPQRQLQQQTSQNNIAKSHFVKYLELINEKLPVDKKPSFTELFKKLQVSTAR